MSMSRQELLDALKDASKAGYFSGMGGGGGFSGGGQQSASSTSGSGDKLSKEFSAAGGAVKGLGDAALGVGSKIAEGGAKLGDVTDALRQGFAGLGAQGSVLGTTLEKGAKGLDTLGQNITQNVETWRKLSDTGLSFGNDIMAMKDQASAARLSIAEMSDVLQKSNSAMLGFGTTSAESAKKLTKMSNEFFTSGLGEELRGMGYTTKELNEVLAVSISGSKLKDLKDKDGQDRSLKAAAALASEMDAVAKITGQSKQEQLDELRRKATDGQRMAAIDEAIARGGEGAKEAFDAISANGKLMGPQFQKLAEDMAAMGRPSEGMEAAYGLLSSGAKKLMSEAGEAARSGDRERAAQLTKQAAAEQAAFQQTSQYRTMAAQAGIKETQESYAQGAKFRNALAEAGKELGPMATDSEKTAAALKKLDEQVKAEQQAGGKDDKRPDEDKAGASITRFAVDLESRGRDLTKVLNDEVIQKLAKDVAPKITEFSKAFNLGSSTVVQDKLQKPIAAGYDKGRLGRIVNEEAGDKSGPNKGVGDKDAAAKDVIEFNRLINGSQKQSDTALKVIEKIANENSITKEAVVKGAMANKGAGMADLVSQIKKELPATEQPGYKDAKKTELEKTTGKLVSPGNEPSALEGAGRGIEALGGLFRDIPGKVTIVGGETPPPTPAAETPRPRRDSGSLEMAGKMFEDWGKGTIVELHGMESVMRPQDVSKVIESAMAGVRKTMPKIDMASGGGAGAKLEMPKLEMPKLEMPAGGKDKELASLAAEISKMGKPDMSKLDLSTMSKSISTSISSVTGGGSTTTKQVQSDDSKAAEKELASVKEQMQAERAALREKLKAQMGDGSKLGGNAVAKELRTGDEGKAIAEKYKAIMEPLQKQIDAGISFETTKKAAAIEETTKMVSEQIAITKTSNSTLADMYKDDSKSKLDLAKKTNADAFKEAELAKSVIGTSVKGMSDDMLEAMIPKGAKIEDYYIDMNDKIQSFSADAIAKLEENAKNSTNVIESYSVTMSSTSKQMAADIADALPVKEMAAKQEEFKSQFTESQQKIIDDYKGYSEENRSFHAQAMEAGVKEDTETALMIGARISKMKAEIGDRQATEEETAALANEEANKKMFEQQVEKKKEMLDVMQNLGNYSAKRELELKQKAINDALAIEDKKASTIKSDISSALPVEVDNEFGDLDGAIAKNKADDDQAAQTKQMMDAYNKLMGIDVSGKPSDDSHEAYAKMTDDQKDQLKSARSAREADITPKKSIGDMMGGLEIGANGMPIMRSIDSAKQTLNQKTPSPGKKINPETGEEYTPVDTTKPKTAATEKKSESKAATKEATLSDVVAALNTLNTKMAQLIEVNDSGHKSTAKAAKSTAGNIYAR